MKVPKHCLDQLLAAGLLVSEPYVSTHVAYPAGVVIGKPESLPGNRIPGRVAGWGNSGLVVDAPCPRLHYEAGKWIVTVHECIPGPGPGDFVNSWDTPE